MRLKTQRSLVVLAAMAFGVLVACGGSDKATTGPEDSGGVTGTYVLKTVNGSPPPGTYYQSASQRVTLDTATIRLTTSNTFSDIRRTTTIDNTGTHSVITTRTGAYTYSGNQVTLSFLDVFGAQSTEALTLTNRTLSVTEQGVALTFVK